MRGERLWDGPAEPPASPSTRQAAALFGRTSGHGESRLSPRPVVASSARNRKRICHTRGRTASFHHRTFDPSRLSTERRSLIGQAFAYLRTYFDLLLRIQRKSMGVTPHIDSAGGAYVPVFAMTLWKIGRASCR